MSPRQKNNTLFFWQDGAPCWALACLAAMATALAGARYEWFMGFRFFALAVLVGLIVFYHALLPKLVGKRGVFALIGGAVFGLCQAVGDVMAAHLPAGGVLRLLPGFFCFYTAVCLMLLLLLDEQKPYKLPQKWRQSRAVKAAQWLLGGGTKALLVRVCALVLFWLPYYSIFWPGLTSPDTAQQMGMELGFVAMSAHHPPLYSAFLGGCMRIGKAVFGAYYAGVALASALQMLAIALVVAVSLGFLAKRSVPYVWRGACFVLFALLPVFGWYSVTLWKDILFSSFVLLLVLCMVSVCTQRAAYFAFFWRAAALLASALGVIALRNTGIYVVLISGVILLIAIKGCRLQVAAWLLLCVVGWQLLEGPIYRAMNASPIDFKYSLSLPALQMALVARDAKDAMTPEDEALLNALFGGEDIGQYYDFSSADQAVTAIQSDVLKKDMAAYAGLWLRMGLLRPGLYARATLEHVMGYCFPDTTIGLFSTEIYKGLDEIQNETPPMPTMAAAWLVKHEGIERNIPGVSMLYSIGFVFWVLAFCALYAVYQRRYVALVPISVLAVVWLTCLASPIYASFRYGYPAVMAAPFVAALVLGGRNTGVLPASDKRKPKRGAKLV